MAVIFKFNDGVFAYLVTANLDAVTKYDTKYVAMVNCAGSTYNMDIPAKQLTPKQLEKLVSLARRDNQLVNWNEVYGMPWPPGWITTSVNGICYGISPLGQEHS